MAYNASGKVRDCQKIADEWGDKDQVIIIALDRRLNTITMASYGRTKNLCADAERLGNAAYDAVCNARGWGTVSSPLRP